MEPKTDLALVLRSTPFEERHRIVTAITEHHGVISAMARNSIQSRRFGGTLEIFAAADWQFVQKPGAEMVHLSEAKIRRAYQGLRSDFEKLSLASVLNELMIRVGPKSEASSELFRLHSNALAQLEESAASIKLLNAYLLKLLQWNGSQPQLDYCFGCERTLENLDPREALQMQIQEASWLCSACREGQSSGHTLSALLISDFRRMMQAPIKQCVNVCVADVSEHRNGFSSLESMLIWHIPGMDQHPLKGLRFLGLESKIQPARANPRL